MATYTHGFRTPTCSPHTKAQVRPRRAPRYEKLRCARIEDRNDQHHAMMSSTIARAATGRVSVRQARDCPAAQGRQGELTGIPMATDIAFALGVLALLGSRVPVSLELFVAALAIVDDIIAVLVIAVFYTAHLSFSYLALGAAGLALSYAANKVGVRNPWVYVAIGILVWFAVMQSGVHATIAGDEDVRLHDSM